MLKYVEIDGNNRICVTSDIPKLKDGEVVSQSYDFPSDFDFAKQSLYFLLGGKLIRDEQTEHDYLAEEMRVKRDSLLSACDWTQAVDTPLSAEEQVRWREYRQSLRDVPQQPEFPLAVVWPMPPDKLEV